MKTETHTNQNMSGLFYLASGIIKIMGIVHKLVEAKKDARSSMDIKLDVKFVRVESKNVAGLKNSSISVWYPEDLCISKGSDVASFQKKVVCV